MNTQTVEDDLHLLRESANTFVTKSRDYRRLRELRNTVPAFDADRMREMVDLGWFGVLVPEEYGGLGLGFDAMVEILRALGRGLLGEPVAATGVLAPRAIVHCSNEEIKTAILPGVVDGSVVPALAWQERAGTFGYSDCSTTASTKGGMTRLNGEKRFVSGAAAATGFVTTAKTDGVQGLYWISGNTEGISIEHEWRADGTPVSRVKFTDTLVSATLCEGAAAETALGRALDETLVMASAEMQGVIDAACEMTLEYLRTRVQFDKPIGSFQALQHRAVNLYILQEICASVLGDAVDSLDADELRRRQTASRAKARLSDACQRICREAIQLHGAIGNTDEYPLGLYMKRAMVLSAWLGNSTMHRRRFVELGGLAR